MARNGVWSWGQAIQQSELAPLTKLVCLNLYLYVNDLGQGAFPSLTRQAKDTGLARSTLIKHLKAAEEAGYLTVIRKATGEYWAHNRYLPTFPDNVDVFRKAIISESGSPLEPSQFASRTKLVRELDSNYPYNYPYKKYDSNISEGEDLGEGDSY
jgi:hypothetical protein